MVSLRKWLLFLGPKISVFAPKIRFLPYDPNFSRWPILALVMAVNFPPWERFFDFPFRSYSCFRKKILLTAQKVFPLPTVGFYCTVKALAGTHPSREKWFRGHLINWNFPSTHRSGAFWKTSGIQQLPKMVATRTPPGLREMEGGKNISRHQQQGMKPATRLFPKVLVLFGL